MDVKGAKALSERLAEAARNVDREEEGLLTPELRDLPKMQIDAAVRERMTRPLDPGPDHSRRRQPNSAGEENNRME